MSSFHVELIEGMHPQKQGSQNNYTLTREELRNLLDNKETKTIKKLVEDGTIDINLTDIAKKDLISLPLEAQNLEITKLFSERITIIKLSYFADASKEALQLLAAAAKRLGKVQEIAKQTISSSLNAQKKIEILTTLEKYNIDYTPLFTTTLDPELLAFMLSNSRVSPESPEAQNSLQRATQIENFDSITALGQGGVSVSSKISKYTLTRDRLRNLLDKKETETIKKLVEDGTIDINLTDIAEKDLISLPLEAQNLDITQLFSERITIIKLSYFADASKEALPLLAAAAKRLGKVQEIAKQTISSSLNAQKKIEILTTLEKYNIDYTPLFTTTLDPELLAFMLSDSRVSPESLEAHKSLQLATQIEKFDSINDLAQGRVLVSSKLSKYTFTRDKLRNLLDKKETKTIKKLVEDGIIDINLTNIAEKDLISLPIEAQNLEITQLFSERITIIKLSYFADASKEALQLLAAAAKRLGKVQEIAKQTISSSLNAQKKIEILTTLEEYNIDYKKLFPTTLDPELLAFMLSNSRVSPESPEAHKSLQLATQIENFDSINALAQGGVPVSSKIFIASIEKKSLALFNKLTDISSPKVLSEGLLFSLKNNYYNYARTLTSASVPITPEHLLALKNYTKPIIRATPTENILFDILRSTQIDDNTKLTTLYGLFKSSICSTEISPSKARHLLWKLGNQLFCNTENSFTSGHSPVTYVTTAKSVTSSDQSEIHTHCLIMNDLLGITDNSNCDSLQ